MSEKLEAALRLGALPEKSADPLAEKLHQIFRRWAGNCGGHLPETWEAVANEARLELSCAGILASQDVALKHWRKAFDHAVLETAGKCAASLDELAVSCDAAGYFADIHGVRMAAARIRAQFGLAEPVAEEGYIRG